jgi:hypothetical protein
VVVGDAEKALGAVLKLDVLLHRAQVVPQVQLTAGLNAEKDSRARFSAGKRCGGKSGCQSLETI